MCTNNSVRLRQRTRLAKREDVHRTALHSVQQIWICKTLTMISSPWSSRIKCLNYKQMFFAAIITIFNYTKDSHTTSCIQQSIIIGLTFEGVWCSKSAIESSLLLPLIIDCLKLNLFLLFTSAVAEIFTVKLKHHRDHNTMEQPIWALLGDYQCNLLQKHLWSIDQLILL